MSDLKSKKGISFIPSSEVSPEAKLKIEKLMNDKKERLEKLVSDFNSGVFSMQ